MKPLDWSMNMHPKEVRRTIGKYMLADGDDIIIDLERSHGAFLVDAVTGIEYIDFFTYFGSIPIGHNHPKMQQPEFLEKLTLAALSKPSCADFYTTLMAEFVETFGRVAMPADMPNLFLIDSGTLAVENALKTAFDWKVRKIIEAFSQDGDYIADGLGSKIIHFQRAFHGRSGYTLSLTNTADPRKYMYFPKFDWPRVVTPRLSFPVTEDVLAQVRRLEEIAVAQIETAVKQYPGDIAALIIEPIQGEGGDNHFRPEFMAELRRLADEHEFLFLVDEVQSGMGITGKMWAMQHTDVMPDVIAFGKKAQVCGIIANNRVEDVEKHVFEESSRINSTWGGNLVDMVRSTRYLQIMEEENLVQHAAEVGAHMLAGLQNVAEESRGVISNVRGKGLMIAFDLPDEGERNRMLQTMADNKLKALKSGTQSIRFRGMLDVPYEVVDQAVEIVAKSVPI